MDLRQVEIFVAVIEHGSLTGAARALGITQPAVSAALSRLERTVGFTLFRREGRNVVPTSEATLLKAEAVRALAGIGQLDDAAAAIGAAARGSLTVATNPSPGITWLPRIVAAFCQSRPDVTLTLRNRSSQEVRDLLAARAFELGIAEPPFHAGDQVMRRYRFATVMVLRSDHPLARHEVLTPALLDGVGMISMLPGHATTPRLAELFEAAGSRLRIVAHCEFFVISINLAREGVGIALADPISAANAASDTLCIRPFAPTLPYEVAMLQPARGLSLLAAAFAEEVDRQLRPFLLESSP